jgi:ATP-dependent DNA helicase RecG
MLAIQLNKKVLSLKQKINLDDKLQNELTYVKGVGPKKAETLKSELQILTIEDLLYYFPYKYVDRSKFHSTTDSFVENSYVQIKGTVFDMKTEGVGRKQRLIAKFSDGKSSIRLTWFKGIKYVTQNIKPNVEYVLFCKPTFYNGQTSFIHPELEELEKFNTKINTGLEAHYLTTEKMKTSFLNSKAINKVISTILNSYIGGIRETLDYKFCQKHGLIPLKDALINIHQPKDNEILRKAQYRLKFEELFYIQLKILLQRNNNKFIYHGFRFEKVGELFNEFYKNQIPFDLTGAQKRVVREIRQDCNTGKQMNRLVQGDVGSGKTLVALMAMLLAIDNGFQACMMAPTEILASQHYLSLKKFLANMDIEVDLLTGSTKKKDRVLLHENLRNGKTKIIVGTHALIEDEVQFHNLGLAVIDEQHRFGVKQRSKLWKKNSTLPHMLVMTATPIPRTLAMSVYGDLDISVIDELPPGRKPIDTFHLYENKVLRVIGFIRDRVKKGQQVYVVYPLIQENEKMDLKDLEDGYHSLSSHLPPPEFRIGAVHGKMKAEEKDKAMKMFKNKQYDILVSTTVIEVGVDVPNATTMVIENANRFGLSQLHQLRGRVGRGSEKSYCILVTPFKLSKESKIRLDAMCRTNDGFELAEIDMKLRGPGDIEGTQQSGMAFNLKIANLTKDTQMVQITRNAVEELLSTDENLLKPEHTIFKKQLQKLNKKDVNWGMIS